MADVGRSALGLSIGATNLAAVTAERAVTRRPVLTLYPHRPPEVGVPSENPMLNEPGLVITNFVQRVGDADAIVAADGTTHRSETLVADALRALAYAATDGRTLPETVAVTHPAHWGPPAVEAVRVALSRVSEWADGRVALLPDSTAALMALQANPGLPSRGILAVCDFGGTGTTLALVDAANGYQPIGPAVRHTGFSGDEIDQALLTHVIADLSSAGSFDTAATSGVGSLTALRSACRRAKEQLSTTTATTVGVNVPGFSGDIEVTRGDLDEAVRQPLSSFTTVVRDTLQRNGIRAADLAAIASVGGGASIPAITTTLSEQLGVPIITAPRPHLTAAIGSALRASRGPAAGETALAPTAAAAVADPATMSDLAVDPSPAPALAWSEADDDSGIMPIRPGEYPEDQPAAVAPAPVAFEHAAQPVATPAASDPWYRRPAVIMVTTALVVLAIAAVVMIAMRHTSNSGPIAPTSSVSTAPATTTSGGSSPSDTSNSQSPGSSAPSSSQSDTGTPSSTTTAAPTTTTAATTTQAPTTTSSAPTTSQAPTTQTSQQQPFPIFPRGPGGFLQPQPGSP